MYVCIYIYIYIYIYVCVCVNVYQTLYIHVNSSLLHHLHVGTMDSIVPVTLAIISS